MLQDIRKIIGFNTNLVYGISVGGGARGRGGGMTGKS